VLAVGASLAVNHRSVGYMDVLKKAAPEGFDVILEMFAHVNLPTDLALASHRAIICIVGSRSEDIRLNPRHFMNSEVDVRGVFLSMASPAEVAAVHASLRSFLVDGSLKPVVGLQLPLSDAPTAHREVMRPSAGGACGNIVLIP